MMRRRKKRFTRAVMGMHCCGLMHLPAMPCIGRLCDLKRRSTSQHDRHHGNHRYGLRDIELSQEIDVGDPGILCAPIST